MTSNKSAGFKIIGNTERVILIALLLLALGNYLINENDIAVGVLVGGLLFLADFIIIKFLVNSLVNKSYPPRFAVFLFIMKLLILLVLLMVLLIFAKLNIYGFIIALTAIVIVIIGSGLRGNNGTF